MNRGNTKPNSPERIDQLVERLNKKIARLLGKKNRASPPPKKTSNLSFSVIVIVFSLLLWFATGFYYLGENQFGLVLYNGRVVDVIKGIKVGFTKPYPFGDIEIIDASISDFIDLNNIASGNFIALTHDLTAIKVDAKFNYQVSDPVKVFKTTLQKQNNLDNLITWEVQEQIHSYFSKKNRNEIIKSNLTVTANEIKGLVNQKISDIGIKLIKLNINALSEPNANNKVKSVVLATAESAQSTIAEQLINEAKQYEQNQLVQTKVEINRFNQLLPQYKSNPNAVITQMYYDALAEIPINHDTDPKYTLLNMSLSDLIILNNDLSSKNITASQPVSIRERHFDRSVNRDRYTALPINSVETDVNSEGK